MNGTDGVRGALDWIHAQARLRHQAGLRRRLSPRGHDSGVLDLAGNDYLGLSRHPLVVEGAVDAARRWGVGATGSRLVTGTTTLHRQLEEELADFVGTQGALVFSSGYLANLGAVTSLAPEGTHIVSDRLNHASLIDAIRLTRRPTWIYTHGNAEAARRGLVAAEPNPAILVTDALFSVDGDLAPLAELAEHAHQHPAVMVVDEAHTIGVRGPGGRGLANGLGLAGDDTVVLTATLSKAFGSQGGVVLGSRDVIDHVLDSSRSFIFDTGLNPPAVGGALAALRLIRSQPELIAALADRATDLHAAILSAGFTAPTPEGAVQSIAMPTPQIAISAQKWLLARGVHVGCFRPPSVPDGISRLRVTARADLTAAQISDFEHALSDLAADFGLKSQPLSVTY